MPEEIQQEEKVMSSTAVEFTEEEVPEAPVEPYEYSEDRPLIQDFNRRYVDALNEASRESAFGRSPVPAFSSILNDPNYDANDRASKILESVGSIAERVPEEDVVEESVTTGPRTWFQDAMDFTFKLANPTVAISMQIAKDNARDVPDLKSTSKEAMLEARAYVASIPSSEQLNPQEKEDAAFLKYMEFMTARVADDIGWNTGTVGDLAGFLLPQENIRYEEVADILGVEYGAMDAIDYRDFLGRMSAYVRSEAPDKRQEMVESLIASWPEIHGNNRLSLVDTLQVISGEASFEDSARTFDNYAERIDQATLGGATLGKVLSGAIKGFGAIKTASKLKNVEAVTDLVTAGSQGILKEANITPMEAASSLNPLESTNTLVKGADNTYATEVGLIQRDTDIYLEAASKVNTFGLGLSADEQLLARNKAVKTLEDRGGVYEVVAEPINDVSFQVSYRVQGEEGSTIVTHAYTQDEVGGFVSVGGADHIPFDMKATSPVFRFVGDRKELVALPEQLQFKGNLIQGMYDEAVRSALAPNGKKLASKEMKQLEHVLMKGDEAVDELGYNVGKVYTPDELMSEGVEGVRLNERQVSAYQDIRKVMDHLHATKNKEIIDLWKAKGVKLAYQGEDTIPVKMYDTPADAKNAFGMAETRSHWIVDDTNKVHAFESPSELSTELLEKMYAQGYKLTRATERRYFKGPDTNLEWAFTKAEDIREPGGIVLSYRQGYMPRIKKDAFYFVKEKNDIKVGGKIIQGGGTKTVRYFDNFGDASKYSEDLNKDNPGKYTVLADRELSGTDLEHEFIQISGGLFTGKRSEGVPFGLDGTEGTRAGGLEAIQRYVRNIARNVPMSLYRVGLQQRWLNHAKDVGALSKGYTGSFEDAIHGRHIDLQNTSSKFLTDAHNQISFLTGVRTDDEMAMLARYREVAKWFEGGGKLGKWMSRKILNTSVDGITSAIRGANFHLLLGLYNPAQFPIQASGAFLAITIHPVHGLKAVGQMLAYATLDNVLGNPAQKAKALAQMRKQGFDVDGYEAWTKSGLKESILKSNLDYNSIFTDLPYDAGILNKVLSNSTFFHKSGELVSARVAFATAFNYWREANKGKEVTDEALKTILARTETLRLNMTRANSAKFQQGALSIPTQFQQVNTKFFEKLLGRGELTSAEKHRLWIGQTVLFGAAGIPLAKSILPHFLESINPLLPEENRIDALNASPETLNAVNNGMLAWMINDYMDINSVITGRMALGQNFVENLFGLATESVSVLDIALGPTKNLWDGAKDSLSRTLTALTFTMNAEDAAPEDYAAVTQILVESLANIPSSSRNVMKSYDMTHSQFFRNRAGKAIAEWGDLNTQTIVAQAFGFSSEEVAYYHELNNRNLGVIPKTVFQSDSDRIVRFLVDMNTTNDEDRARRYGFAVNAVLTKYKNPADRVRLIQEVKEKTKNPSDPWGKLMLSVIRDWESDLQNGLSEIHARASIKSNPAVARQFANRGMNSAVKEPEGKK